MSKIIFSEINYNEFGRCIQLSNGVIDAVVTVDCGPRVIRFGFKGEVNEFCENPSAEVPIGNDSWRIRGGHRLWHSPEAMPRSYSPDNEPIEWEKIQNGIRVSQKVEPWVQIKKEMDIIMEPEANKMKIIHKLVNKNAWPVEFSAWSLSVMAPGGKEVVPQPNRETGLLGNRVLALWPYSKMNDHRIYWGDKYIVLKQDPNTKQPIKFGINNEFGWVAYINHGNMFINRYNHDMEAKYPDYGVSYETYTTDFMLEMETLSPLTLVNPEGELVHTEEWELVKGVELDSIDEDKIDGIVKKHIG